MIVQVIGFAGLQLKEGILAVFLTEAKALRSRAAVRKARDFVMDTGW